jgi:toluene monooxygenase system ferredoxin subunit
MSFCRATRIDALWSGEMLGLSLSSAGGRRLRILLVNLDGTVHAYEDRCAHQGVELSRGRLVGRLLTCSAHGWTYDLQTGEGVNPIGARLRPIPVKIDGDDILVEIDDGRTT